MSDFKAKKAQNSISAGAPPQTPLWELTALLRPPADPILALGPPGLETTCVPKYVSLNPPMYDFRGKRPFCVFEPPLGDLGATYDDQLRLIGKRVWDFLLVLIELYSLDRTAEALRANYWFKIGDFAPTGAG